MEDCRLKNPGRVGWVKKSGGSKSRGRGVKKSGGQKVRGSKKSGTHKFEKKRVLIIILCSSGNV